MKAWTIVFLILMVACSSQQFVCPDGSIVEDPGLCPELKEDIPEEPLEDIKEEVEEELPTEKTAEPEEIVEEETPEYVIDDDVQEMLSKAAKRSKMFSFLHVGPPDNLPQDHYYVKDNMMKVELLRATDHKLSQEYTHVYIDLDKRTATAYCEYDDSPRCPDGPKKIGSVDFEKHYVRTPYEWMLALKSATHDGKGAKFENRATERVLFETEEGKGVMRVTDFYFVPALIQFNDGTVYEFRDLKIVQIDDDEVMPPADLI